MGNSKKVKAILTGALPLLIVVFGCWGSSWTLMICDEMLDDYQCYSNSAVYEDAYDDLASCQSAGSQISGGRKFECGENCDTDNYGGYYVCDQVCNGKGCN